MDPFERHPRESHQEVGEKFNSILHAFGRENAAVSRNIFNPFFQLYQFKYDVCHRYYSILGGSNHNLIFKKDYMD